MTVTIRTADGSNEKEIINLKNFLDRSGIEGLDAATIDRKEHHLGEQGAGGILDSITAIISAAGRPLVELVKCLQKYVDNYRTYITIPTKNGNIKIEHGRSMKPEQLQQMVEAISNGNAKE